MEIKKFNEMFKSEIKTIKEFEESFPNFKVDFLETEIEEFAHPDPMDDFERAYILVDDSVEMEKEYVFIEENDNGEEVWVYTDKDGYIHGYAFNHD